MEKPTLALGQAVPEWIIHRAAVYMVRRYGAAALKRAAARRRFLLRAGDDLAAAHWMRVAEAIGAIAVSEQSEAEAL